MVSNQLRFRDLKARGIISNWATLNSWINNRGFPPGRLVAPNTRLWDESEIADWLKTRPSARKITPQSPGRPRGKAELAGADA
jgi:predicted DNA-binding transcriptional regulator AlpA